MVGSFIDELVRSSLEHCLFNFLGSFIKVVDLSSMQLAWCHLCRLRRQADGAAAASIVVSAIVGYQDRRRLSEYLPRLTMVDLVQHQGITLPLTAGCVVQGSIQVECENVALCDPIVVMVLQ